MALLIAVRLCFGDRIPKNLNGIPVINFVWKAVCLIFLQALLVFVLDLAIAYSVEWNIKSVLQSFLAMQIDCYQCQFHSVPLLSLMGHQEDACSAECIFQLRLGVAVSMCCQRHNPTSHFA